MVRRQENRPASRLVAQRAPKGCESQSDEEGIHRGGVRQANAQRENRRCQHHQLISCRWLAPSWLEVVGLAPNPSSGRLSRIVAETGKMAIAVGTFLVAASVPCVHAESRSCHSNVAAIRHPTSVLKISLY